MENPTYEPIKEKLDEPATKGDLAGVQAELKAEMEIMRQEITNNFAELPTRADYHRLLSAMDGVVKEIRLANEERAVESHRFERLEEYAKTVGKVIKIEFET